MQSLRFLLMPWIDPTGGARPYTVDFAMANPDEVHQRLLEDGCCLLKRAISPQYINHYARKLEKLYKRMAREQTNEKVEEEGERVHIGEERFTSEYGQGHSLFALLDEPKFKHILNGVFGVQQHSPSLRDSHSRTITLRRHMPDRSGFAPNTLNLDVLSHHYHDRFGVNFWIPLRSCGYGTSRPGLAVYPVGFEAVRECLRCERWEDLEAILPRLARTDDPKQQDSVAWIKRNLSEMFTRDAIPMITPHFEVGDVMLINNWTPYGTYAERGMHGMRRNLELRFHGDRWNPQFSEQEFRRAS